VDQRGLIGRDSCSPLDPGPTPRSITTSKGFQTSNQRSHGPKCQFKARQAPRRRRPLVRRVQKTSEMLQRLCGIEQVTAWRLRDAGWRISSVPTPQRGGHPSERGHRCPSCPPGSTKLPPPFKVQARKAYAPVVSVHSTRRTCASLPVELDVHPRVAMQILRHSRISITMDLYSQVAAASTREAVGRLGTTLAIKCQVPPPA
jgi:hypothetical protein